jgi:DNA polymerase-3 subunit beta
MRFRTELKNLLEAVGIVSRAVAVKGIKPILANLLITAHGSELRFVGTDQEIMMISTIAANVESEGHFTIPARLLQEILSCLPGDDSAQVLFELDDDQSSEITISSGRNRFNLQIQGIDDFPPVPVLETSEIPSFSISCDSFAKALKEANVAVAVDDGNPVQKSIFFDFSTQSRPVMASTDSKRLAVTVVPQLDVPELFRRSFIVPSRAIAELYKLLDGNESISLGTYKEQLVFSSQHFQLITRLVDGKFPDYNRVLPKESSRVLKINRKELTQALKAVAPIARNSSGLVHFDISQNETKVWSDAKDQGKAEMFISSELTGDAINIAFNVKFMQDFLGAIIDEEIYLEMTTPSYPGLLRPVNPESEFKYVLMPMSY